MAKEQLIVTTTNSVEGYRIKEYLGIVCGEVVTGANFFKDWCASITNFWGGRSGSYEKELIKAREGGLEEMLERARDKGANAVIGVDVDYEVITIDNGCLLMSSASGTAVVLEKI